MKEKKVFEFGPEQPCKVCGRMIPIPMVYCSTKCNEADEAAKEREKMKAESLSNHAYTFSGWLRFVKDMSEEEISGLFDDDEKWTELQREYDEYMDARDKRLAELEEKAIRRKKKGRRTNKGTFHGKSRGKYVKENF